MTVLSGRMVIPNTQMTAVPHLFDEMDNTSRSLKLHHLTELSESLVVHSVKSSELKNACARATPLY